VRGSVFKMEFTALSRKFESIETSPGFAQLLGENWNQSHKKMNNKDQVRKKLSNDKSLEVYVTISQKKLVAQFLTRKMTRNRMNENPEN
jgi:hypothetical protein